MRTEAGSPKSEEKRVNKMDKNQKSDEWLVIVNPNAGKGKGKKDWHKISSLLKKYSINFEAIFTESKSHAGRLAAEGISSGFRKVISVGGDGTLNEIVNGIFTQDSCPTSDITLALIPVGTGNDWGRMFGIPLLYESAVKTISEGKQIAHDIGKVSYFNGNNPEIRYFINIAGLGFEAAVVKRTNTQKDKGRSNKAIYFYNLLMSLISYKNTDAVLSIDGQEVSSKVFSISVGNGRYCGGGMRQTPEALTDDGLLDITVINGMGKIEIIRNLQILYDGTILSHPKVDGYRSSRVQVKSDKLLFAEADGESIGHTPIEFTIIPAGINIIYATRINQ
jgi:diacylglycerol kinase (ATP)